MKIIDLTNKTKPELFKLLNLVAISDADDETKLRTDGQSYEYLWIYWTFSSKWEFWKQNTEQVYMTQDEASKAYDSLFPIEATKRLRIKNEIRIN